MAAAVACPPPTASVAAVAALGATLACTQGPDAVRLECPSTPLAP